MPTDSSEKPEFLVITSPDTEGIATKVDVILDPQATAPSQRLRSYTLAVADGWSVETTGTMVIASRYDTDDDPNASPVEVRAWPIAFGGAGVVAIHTGPVDPTTGTVAGSW